MRKLRIIVAKAGLDGHDRGAKVVSRALRDAGFEVIYTGLRQSPEQIVSTAIDEGADFIGISILSGAHMIVAEKIIRILKKRNAADIPVFMGGIIPDSDIPDLKKIGIKAVFGPGTPTSKTITYLKNYHENDNS
ncbi:MAG: cobalamin B12-binding domain-containing protein [Epsilonproteobacteria bacterium]|nr:cobalamin B12-binding domain-containing protein [Campylobacterota bacterium]